MSRLTWNDPGSNLFETGIDRVVLYSTDGNAIAWNGIKQITEKTEGSGTTPLYIDGMKFIESRVYGDYAATIDAYAAPREFGAHDGTAFDLQGIGYGLQPIKPFSFSYRTLVGNDTDREDLGYKIHVVFNAYATASDRSYESLSSDINPVEFSWDITTVPSRIPGRRPTAHLIIDSRQVEPILLSTIEDHLYGGDGVIGRLTDMSSFLSLIDEFISLEFYVEQDNSGTYTLQQYRGYKRNTVPILNLGEEAFWLDTSSSSDGSAGFLNYVIGE